MGATTVIVAVAIGDRCRSNGSELVCLINSSENQRAKYSSSDYVVGIDRLEWARCLCLLASLVKFMQQLCYYSNDFNLSSGDARLLSLHCFEKLS